jgi:hypothetical protein
VITAVLAALGLSLANVPALAETTDCRRINTVPAVITLPGVYCLKRSFVTAIAAGAAIEIKADDVVLDLNGWSLTGTGDFGTEAVGIAADGREKITIRNGTVRGFRAGIQLLGLAGRTRENIVEHVRANDNTQVGIQVHGAGSIVLQKSGDRDRNQRHRVRDRHFRNRPGDGDREQRCHRDDGPQG